MNKTGFTSFGSPEAIPVGGLTNTTASNKTVEDLAHCFTYQIVHSEEGHYDIVYGKVLSTIDAFLTSQRQTLRDEIGKLEKSVYTREMPPTSEKQWYNQALADVLKVIDEI